MKTKEVINPTNEQIDVQLSNGQVVHLLPGQKMLGVEIDENQKSVKDRSLKCIFQLND